jgi:hypothetical protein
MGMCIILGSIMGAYMGCWLSPAAPGWVRGIRGSRLGTGGFILKNALRSARVGKAGGATGGGWADEAALLLDSTLASRLSPFTGAVNPVRGTSSTSSHLPAADDPRSPRLCGGYELAVEPFPEPGFGAPPSRLSAEFRPELLELLRDESPKPAGRLGPALPRPRPDPATAGFSASALGTAEAQVLVGSAVAEIPAGLVLGARPGPLRSCREETNDLPRPRRRTLDLAASG